MDLSIYVILHYAVIECMHVYVCLSCSSINACHSVYNYCGSGLGKETVNIAQLYNLVSRINNTVIHVCVQG